MLHNTVYMQRNIRQRFIFALIVSERGINGLYRAAAEPRDKGYLLIYINIVLDSYF